MVTSPTARNIVTSPFQQPKQPPVSPNTQVNVQNPKTPVPQPMVLSPSVDTFHSSAIRAQSQPKFGATGPEKGKGGGFLNGISKGVEWGFKGGLLSGLAATGLVIAQVVAAPFSAGITLLTAVKTAILSAFAVPAIGVAAGVVGLLKGLNKN